MHDNICSLIQKKCHPKSYHSDIKHHVTLNIIIFSVASSMEPEPKRSFYTVVNNGGHINCEWLLNAKGMHIIPRKIQ